MPSDYELEMMREIAQWQREADQRARTGRPATRISVLRPGGRAVVSDQMELTVVQPPTITDGANNPDAE